MSPAPSHDPGAAAWAPRRRPGLLALVLLGHVLLLLGWHLGLMPRMRGTADPPQPPALVWLNLATAPKPPLPAALALPSKARAHTTTEPLLTAGPVAQHLAPAPAPPPVAPLATDPLTTAIRLPAPETPASAASAPGLRLMDTAATRAALRQAGRTPLWSERTANATVQPFVSKAEKQADAVAKSAKGDCVKGEFSGGGMGLLSLPFLAVAEVSGHCAR